VKVKIPYARDKHSTTFTQERQRIMIGKKISHYHILEKLGEGGMGVVYLAEDTRLDRKVAIKFLPSHIAGNSEERKRFEIEAKAAASLNHPNIATIHAIEEADDEMLTVMENIEGLGIKKHRQGAS
jgi:serine/threonine protein kinase